MNHSTDQTKNAEILIPPPRNALVLLPTMEGRTLTKAELTDLLFERLGLNKREAKEMVDAFFHRIEISLIKGEGVKLSGFGSFSIRHKVARPGRNPKTGEPVLIQARSVVTFHPSPKLKAIIQGWKPPHHHSVG